MIAASLAVATVRGWPWVLATIEALAFASGMTLVFFGEQLPIGYTPKAMLIVLAVLVSTWAFNRLMQRSEQQARTAKTVQPVR